MAYFRTWSEWLKLRESNARKRAVRAALSGTGPDMAGSYAACPSTNPRAMKVAREKGVVTKLPMDESEKSPNYSFDNWLKNANKLGGDINKIMSDAEKEEKDLDQKKKKSEKEVEDDKKELNKDKYSIEKEEGDKEEDDNKTSSMKKVKNKCNN